MIYGLFVLASTGARFELISTQLELIACCSTRILYLASLL